MHAKSGSRHLILAAPAPWIRVGACSNMSAQATDSPLTYVWHLRERERDQMVYVYVDVWDRHEAYMAKIEGRDWWNIDVSYYIHGWTESNQQGQERLATWALLSLFLTSLSPSLSLPLWLLRRSFPVGLSFYEFKAILPSSAFIV